MRYAEAVRALEDRQEAKWDLGLSRFSGHLKRLGDPQRLLRTIHVAGTNGKGSVCAILDSVLRAQGYKTGLYTSPHLMSFRERIKVNGEAISEAAFARLLGKSLEADPQAHLTYFELLTSVAFQYFQEMRVDVAVLETGLGGRLDATNVIKKPLACLITSIDFDHTRHLGRTLARIAGEKAGIIKKGSPVFCPPLRPQAMAVIKAKARSMGAPFKAAGRPWKALKVDWRENNQWIKDTGGRSHRLSLLGGAQPRNLALCHETLSGLREVLPVSGKSWERGLARVRWPGRFEVRSMGPRTLVLDGAHNLEAAAQLKKTLAASPWGKRPVRFILGMLKDKDIKGILRTLSPLRDVVTCTPASPRAMDAVDLAREVRKQAASARISVEHDLETALAAWRKEGRGPKTAVVCGSFYLVGKATSILS